MQDPTLSEIPEDADEPASKGDVCAAVDELAQIAAGQFEHTERHLERIDEQLGTTHERLESLEATAASKDDVARLERSQKAVLDVLQSIDQRIRNWQDVPSRLESVEADVFQLKSRR